MNGKIKIIIKFKIKIKINILTLISWESTKTFLNIKIKYNIIAQRFIIKIRLFYININLPTPRLIIKIGIYYYKAY